MTAKACTNCFREASSIFPERDVNPCKRLWKMLFRCHRQYLSQYGNVGAMRFGKVYPRHF